jgi:hypothetical protein
LSLQGLLSLPHWRRSCISWILLTGLLILVGGGTDCLPCLTLGVPGAQARTGGVEIGTCVGPVSSPKKGI